MKSIANSGAQHFLKTRPLLFRGINIKVGTPFIVVLKSWLHFLKPGALYCYGYSRGIKLQKMNRQNNRGPWKKTN